MAVTHTVGSLGLRIAARDGRERPVRDLVMGDLPDVAYHVDAGSLVLLPADAVPAEAPTWQALAERGVAAVAVRAGPPGGLATAVRHCRPHGLPVLSVPRSRHWCAVAAGLLALVDAEAGSLRGWFIRQVLQGWGTHSFLEQLRCLFERPVGYYDAELRLVDLSGRARYGFRPRALGERRLFDEAAGPFRFASADGAAHVQPLDRQRKRLGYLVAWQGGRPLVPLEAEAFAQAAEVFTWECVVEARSVHWRRHGRGQLFERLLVERGGGPREARALAATLGILLAGRQAALAVRLQPGSAVAGERLAAALERAAERAGVRAFWDEVPGGYAAVLDLPGGLPEGAVRARCRQVAEALLAEGRAAFPGSQVAVGIGRPVDGPEDLAESFSQARRALWLGGRLRGGGAFALEDLGVLGLLAGTSPPDDLRAAALRPLRALRAADAAGAPELRRTLEAWLEVDGDRGRAAALLNVHANTVAYRLRRIEAATGLSPQRLKDLLQLQLALFMEAAADDT